MSFTIERRAGRRLSRNFARTAPALAGRRRRTVYAEKLDKTSDCRKTDRSNRLAVRRAASRPRRDPASERRIAASRASSSPNPAEYSALARSSPRQRLREIPQKPPDFQPPATATLISSRFSASDPARLRAFKKKSLVRAHSPGRKVPKTSPLSAAISSIRALTSSLQAKSPKKLACSPKLPIVTSVFASTLKRLSSLCKGPAAKNFLRPYRQNCCKPVFPW